MSDLPRLKYGCFATTSPSGVVIFIFLLITAVGYALYRRRKGRQEAEGPISTLEVDDKNNRNIFEAGDNAREERKSPLQFFQADNKYVSELDAGFVGHEVDGVPRDKSTGPQNFRGIYDLHVHKLYIFN